jgi:branched-subunit amino acid transport protein AzlD
MGRDVPPGAGVWVYLVPVLIIGLVILRNARARHLKVERLWVSPVLLLVLTATTFSQQQMPTPMMIAGDIAALALGATLGWWRGRFTKITVNPETHDLTSQASPVGMVLILAIMLIRQGLRGYATANAGALHVSVVEVTDAFLLLAVGLVCAQRLEMALRANRLLTEARAAKTA